MRRNDEYLCLDCDAVLRALDPEIFCDADGINNHAERTGFQCPDCQREYQRMYVPRARVVDGEVVDAGRTFWYGDEPRPA